MLLVLLPLSSCGDEGPIFTKGDGSETNPYIVETSDQVRRLCDIFYTEPENFYKAHYLLANDIDLSGFPITSIGSNSTYPFNGVFDGAGHKISGYSIGKYVKNAGLFAILGEEAVVKNLSVSVDFSRSGKGYNAGAIAGTTSKGSLIENCEVTGTMKYTVTTSDSLQLVNSINVYGNYPVYANVVGGVVGVNNGTIRNCKTSISLSGDIIGGICGSSSGEIDSCETNNTSLKGRDIVGGLIGYGFNTSISYSSALNIEAQSSQAFGGIIGVANFRCKVKSCQFAGKINFEKSQYEYKVGSIIGQSITNTNVYDGWHTILDLSRVCSVATSISSLVCNVPNGNKCYIGVPESTLTLVSSTKTIGFISLANQDKQANIDIAKGSANSMVYVPDYYQNKKDGHNLLGQESVSVMASYLGQQESDFVKIENSEIYGYYLKNITKES